MNSVYNQALRQANSIKKDLEGFISLEIDDSTVATQGQLSASITSFARTVDDYDGMAKRELVEAKREKAFERVKRFKQELADFRKGFDQAKKEREEQETSHAKNELLSRRGRYAATPDNPYAYKTPLNPASSSAEATFREHDFLGRASQQIDEFIERGRQVVGDLGEQRSMLKSTQKKLYTAGNKLGVSRDTIRSVEKRVREDKWIFLVGAGTTIICFVLIIRWLR